MSRFLAVVLATVLVGTTAYGAAANETPVVTDVVASVDAQGGKVIVDYAVADTEFEGLRIDLRVSADGGETFLVETDSVSGDAGFPVAPGPRQLVWHFDPQALNDGTYVAKIVADDGIEIDLAEVIAKVDSARLRADVTFMEGRRHYVTGPALIAATKDYIEEAFDAHGLQASRQPFTYRTWSPENIIGRLPGTTREAEVFIIDGHFDTVSNTRGADDNASGTAGMLEAMRVLSQYNFERTIKFLGFDLEESGLIGSLRYVQSGRAPYDEMLGVVNFEMIGFTCETLDCDAFAEVGNYIHNISDVQSNWLRAEFDLMAATYVPGLVIESTEADPANPNFRRSDHARFWDAGVAALFLTDGANFRNPHYHQLSDRVGTLDFEFMSNIVKVTVATIARQARVQHAGVGLSQPFVIETGVATNAQSFGQLKRSFRRSQK